MPGPQAHSHCQELSTPSNNCSQAPANLMFLQLKKQTNKKQQQKKKMKSNRPLAEAPEAPGKHGAPGRGHGPTCWWLLEAFRTLHRSSCDSTKPGCSRHFSGSGPPHSTTEGLMEEAARHTPLPVYKSSAFLASFLKESSKTT